MKEINENELKDVTGGDTPNGCTVITCSEGMYFNENECQCMTIPDVNVDFSNFNIPQIK